MIKGGKKNKNKNKSEAKSNLRAIIIIKVMHGYKKISCSLEENTSAFIL